jgi:hypothetical protein
MDLQKAFVGLIRWVMIELCYRNEYYAINLPAEYTAQISNTSNMYFLLHISFGSCVIIRLPLARSYPWIPTNSCYPGEINAPLSSTSRILGLLLVVVQYWDWVYIQILEPTNIRFPSFTPITRSPLFARPTRTMYMTLAVISLNHHTFVAPIWCRTWTRMCEKQQHNWR